MSVKPIFERENDVVDVPTDLYKRLFESRSLKRTSLPESYIEGDLDIHVYFGLGSGGDECETRHYCAVFKSSDGSLVEETAFAVPVVLGAESGSFESLSGELVYPVFIPVRKTAEGREDRKTGIFFHIVRLQYLDECSIVSVHALDLPIPAFERVFRCFGARIEAGVEGTLGEDGEGGAAGRFAPVPDNQLPSQMIQGGPPIVDDVPDDGTPFRGAAPLGPSSTGRTRQAWGGLR